MNLLAVEKLTKTYGEKVLFQEITFGIEEGDKIGVIGVNGTGKSTLLKLIAGIETPDSGIITKASGMKIGYLPQEPDFGENTTVLEQVFQSENPTMQLVKQYEEVSKQLEQHPSEALEKKLAQLAEQMDKLQAWNLESEAKTILTKLGITDFEKKVSNLSGGQKKRVAMASALITPVELLILDEPTNHIDTEAIDWLESYLAKYKKALLMVTHDRYFLDRVVNRTMEIDKGNVYTYQVNYSGFLERKAQREELELAGERKRQNLLRTELEWVRRGARARTTKQKARLQRFEEISSQKAPQIKANVEIDVGVSRLGKKIIEAEHISKSYNHKQYVSDFSYIILKNDRVGIVGKNGCGKSTLVKMLTGQIVPDSGTVEIGETVKIGVFSQENEELDYSKRVIDVIKDVAEYIPTSDGKITASQMLERFLFSPDAQYSPVSKLSGGEKRRLYLLKVLMASPNVLFLDEPTNDLDIETLAVLEQYLDGFQGAVVAVSHDRYFLDRTVGRIFAFENGTIKQYEGGYTDYKEQSMEEEVQTTPEKKKESQRPQKEKPKKLSYSEQREYDTIGDTIAELEKAIEKDEKEIETLGSDYVKLQEVLEHKQKLEQELETAMDRWLALEELAEEIEKSKQ